MPCARLHELPPPPPGKQGWPWTEGSPAGTDPAAVCLVMPSLNQAAYLEAALRSVLLQGLPNLELRVMDGGSTDGSTDILEKYRPWIDHLHVGPDAGQAAAINRGFREGGGELLAWLATDDLLLPGGLQTLLALRSQHPQAGVWVGASRIFDSQDRLVRTREPVLGTVEELAHWFVKAGFQQPGTLFERRLFEDLGGLNEQLQCFLDVEFWLRARQRVPFAATSTPVAVARIYPEAKSFRLSDRQIAEWVACTWNLGLPQVAEWRVRRSLDRAAAPERLLPHLKTRVLLRHLVQRLFHRA